jgi:hypothetical protein
VLHGQADQEKYVRNKKTQDGYFSISEAESAKGMQVKDLKQYYQLYFPAGRYPSEVSDAAERLFQELIDLGRRLLEWIDEVGCCSLVFDSHFQSDWIACACLKLRRMLFIISLPVSTAHGP